MFKTLAISFSIMTLFTGITPLYGSSLQYAGPASLVWGWVVVCFFTWFVGIAMAEICSSFPTTGSLYFWAAHLAGSQTLQSIILLSTGTNKGGGYFAPKWLFLCMYIGLTVIGGAVIVIMLPLVALTTQSASYVFTNFELAPNTTGISSKPYAVILSFLVSQYSLYGYDAAAHLTEETKGADKNGPIAILAICILLGLPILKVNVVFTAITSICTIGWVGGYAVPIFARMVMPEKNFKAGPFYLGKARRPICYIAIHTMIEEAEAQCALLNSESLCDGCFSSDSDIFLFGARTVYREICLGDGGYVVCYEMAEIENKLGLGRDSLIALSLLLGSDYHQGVHGLGPELACQIVKSIGEKDVLKKFASEGLGWVKKRKGIYTLVISILHFSSILQLFLIIFSIFFVYAGAKNNIGKDDTILQVIDAYLKPKCHSADSDFVLKAHSQYPFQRTKLHHICVVYFEWPSERT
ncbi:hypothetical protein RYX36_026005, partial [Vicia faba]